MSEENLDFEEGMNLVEELSENIFNDKRYRGNSNFVRLMKKLNQKCVNHTIAENGSASELESYYWMAREFVSEIQSLNCFEIGSYDRSDFDESYEEDSIYESYDFNIVWRRKNPNTSFQEGFECKDYFRADKEQIHSLVITYIKNRWMRHSYLDWVLMDMMITQELCAYNEELKKNKFFTAPYSFSWGSAYFKYKGNFDKIRNYHYRELLKKFFFKMAIFFILPISLTFMFFHFDKDDYGFIAGAISIGILIFFGSVSILRFVLKAIKGGIKEVNQEPQSFKLSQSMQEVWRRLGSSIISPIRIKESMVESEKLGAVWDEASFTLLERIIERDGTEWIVDLD